MAAVAAQFARPLPTRGSLLQPPDASVLRSKLDNIYRIQVQCRLFVLKIARVCA